MKPPPFLLGAALIFWGWQSELLLAGIAMAAVIEGARFTDLRWELTDDDFRRIWTFCTLLFLAAAVYAFTNNGGPSRFGDLFQNPTSGRQMRAGTASARTAADVLRWLPMLLFLFAAAQVYSAREKIPLTTISLFLRKQWQRAQKLGRPLPVAYEMNVGYLYFAVCLFSASIHQGSDDSYFWGLCVLLTWGLLPLRSRRFGLIIWGSALAVALALGFLGQHSVGRLQMYIQTLDAQILATFIARNSDPQQTRTSIGSVGRVKSSGKIMIRLQPQEGEVPSYLREATYRVYKSPVWYAGSSKDDFETMLGDTNHTTWFVLPEKRHTARVTLACYLEGRSRQSGAPIGLLPLPPDTSRIENLPAFSMRRNSAGSVVTEGPALLIFDALYGAGGIFDSAPGTNEDLLISAREVSALDDVISELQLAGKSRDEAMRALQSFFQNEFTYSTWQGQPPKGSDSPLSRFLLETRSGHCEYFATATVLLLRRLGFPARYGVGYYVHEASRDGYVVRLRDAHAWTLVWNEGTGAWENFDTTPASWVAVETTGGFGQRVADAWSWIRFQLSKIRWGQTNLRGFMLLSVIPVLGFLLYQILFRRKRRRDRRKGGRADEHVVWPGLDSEFYLVEQELAARGFVRKPNETLADWLQRAVTDPALADSDELLRELLRLHYRYRFDPEGLSRPDREELRREARHCLDKLGEKREHSVRG